MRQPKAILTLLALIPLFAIRTGEVSADPLMTVNNHYSTTLHQVSVNPGNSFAVDIYTYNQVIAIDARLLSSTSNVFDVVAGFYLSPWDTTFSFPTGGLDPLSETFETTAPFERNFGSPPRIATVFIRVDAGAPIGNYTLNVSEIHYNVCPVCPPPSNGTPGPDFIVQVVNGPIISLDRNSFDRTAFNVGGSLTSNQFNIWNSGSSSFKYTITDDAAWLSVSPASGFCIGEYDTIDVMYDLTGLSAGTHHATISVGSASAANSPQLLDVNILVGDRPIRPDLDGDGDVDQTDYGLLQKCAGYLPVSPECQSADFDLDNDVDAYEINVFLSCSAGSDVPADPSCDNW